MHTGGGRVGQRISVTTHLLLQAGQVTQGQAGVHAGGGGVEEQPQTGVASPQAQATVNRERRLPCRQWCRLEIMCLNEFMQLDV